MRSHFSTTKTFITALFLIIALNSCTKTSNGTSCDFDPCGSKAPDAQATVIQTYLNTNGITATKHCSNMYYKIITDGTGGNPTICSKVRIKYEGEFIINNNGKFDSNNDATFELTGLIQGWKNAINVLKKGSKVRLYIPPTLGYGSQGNASIPPNAYLQFDIEVLDIL
jgi:FKBP-type peptidyl-prolyl cis-trans isomerase FkpA